MGIGNRLVWAAVFFFGLPAFAERPPARGHAAAELFVSPDGVEGPTPGARYLARLPVHAREALRREGRVVLDQKNADGLVRAVIRFERSRDEVFAAITQPSQQQRYLSHVSESKTVGRRTDEGESVDMHVSFLFVSLQYRIQHWFYPEEYRMEWSLDPSGDNGLVEQAGFFQLYALDEKTTIAEYGTRAIAKDGFLDFIRGLGERDGVSDALASLRRHVHLGR